MGSVESGRVFAGRYRLVTRLGRGGFGEVWSAEDTVLERQVAVKTLIVSAGGDDLLLRFEREAHALARLDHPNIVAVYDTGADDGTGFVVMQLLAGPSLAALVAERRYAFETHCCAARPPPRSRSIAGSATPTIEPSTDTTADPRIAATSTRR
jgi:serine/threonine protein kinase